MSNNTDHQRAQMRRTLSQQRSQLDATDRKQAAAKIVTRLLDHPMLQRSQIIAGYLSVDGEVDIQDWFTQAWKRLKHCYLPVVVKQQLLFAPYYQETQLIPNQWGILEPPKDILILPSDLEALIVPLLGFDAKGNRLGRGAGYYDRSFAFLRDKLSVKKPYLIGVGYAFQQVPTLTPADWDIPLQTVIVETKTF
jgi:5-formyltetrahydrofolate cyclo-ligase